MLNYSNGIINSKDQGIFPAYWNLK